MKPRGSRQRALVNPVELAIFMVSVGIFGVSAYRFFQDSAQLEKIAQMTSENAPSVPQTTRKPANFTERFTEIKIHCNELDHPVQTGASKVRLILTSCPKGLKDIRVENSQNRAPATVFYEGTALSTDYVPVSNGENTLKITAKTTRNETWSAQLKIIKN